MQNISNLFNVTETQKPMSDKEFEEMKSNDYNNMEGTLNKVDGIDCPLCKNKGHISKVAFIDMYQRYDNVMYPCKCMMQRNLSRKAINSGLGEYLKKRSSDYKVEEEWQSNCFNAMVNFCKSESDTPKWFVAVGQSGSGKTLLCSIIGNHLLFNLNKQVIYLTWTDFISKLKRDIMGNSSDAVSGYLEDIKNCEVLFIDELLKKYSEADLKYIIEIINYRYTNDLKTIITSERSIDELLDIDEATFGRVIEKAERFIIDIPKDRKKNYRLKALR